MATYRALKLDPDLAHHKPVFLRSFDHLVVFGSCKQVNTSEVTMRRLMKCGADVVSGRCLSNPPDRHSEKRSVPFEPLD